MCIRDRNKTNINNNIFQYLGDSLQSVTEPEVLNDNDVDEVADTKESLDKIEEGNIKLQTGNSYCVFFLAVIVSNVYMYYNFNV